MLNVAQDNSLAPVGWDASVLGLLGLALLLAIPVIVVATVILRRSAGAQRPPTGADSTTRGSEAGVGTPTAKSHGSEHQ